MTSSPSIYFSWHHDSIAWQDSSHTISLCDDVLYHDNGLPELADEAIHLAHVYLPIEEMLSRAVQFPFSSPDLVDADMLFQMLNDDVDAKIDDWWLAWHLEPCQDGVAGMVFGMPESWRQSMQHNENWSDAKIIGVDAYERLHVHAEQGIAAVIISQDEDGLFFGFFDGQAWRGMRRLNVSTWQQSEQFQLEKSLQAMGFEAQQHAVVGIASETMWQYLHDQTWQTEGKVWKNLPTRHEANLALDDTSISTLNFRHGHWSAKQVWQRWSFWQRSVTLMLATLMIWFAGTWYQLNQLDTALKNQQARIVAAFHQGLPQATVMLDPLAQLKQATGGESTQVNHLFLSDLEQVGSVYQQQPWQLNALSLREGQMNMTGTVPSLKQLNNIQQALQQKLKQEVRIVDTQMAKNHVSFRMTW
ncbi:MAG: hypothetical protein Q9M11_08455 [Mariprofundaceae bacterium]|nr:hypothetical protein [Mariprofundaceae bacterium]